MRDKVRVKKDTPLEEILTMLNPQQRRLMRAVSRCKADEQAGIQRVKHRTAKAVEQALEGGVPAVALTELLGVTRGRIYQMRDEAKSP